LGCSSGFVGNFSVSVTPTDKDVGRRQQEQGGSFAGRSAFLFATFSLAQQRKSRRKNFKTSATLTAIKSVNADEKFNSNQNQHSQGKRGSILYQFFF